MLVKTIPTCVRCSNNRAHIKAGFELGRACCGDPEGRKWDLHVAGKEGRCGPRRVWFVRKVD